MWEPFDVVQRSQPPEGDSRWTRVQTGREEGVCRDQLKLSGAIMFLAFKVLF